MALESYTAATSTTELAEIIPEIIAPEITASAARQEVFRPLAREFNVTGTGSPFQHPTAPELSFGSLTENTAPAETQFDVGERSITPAMYGVDVVVSMPAMQNSALSVTDAIISEVAIALVKHRDGLFGALYTEAPAATPDHEIGTDGTELTFTSLRDGMALLYTQNAPRRFAWVVTPTQFVELLKDDTFINASVKGAPVLTQGLGANGYATSVLDVDVYVSDQIAASSGTAYQSMMFSKNAAFGYAYKMLSSPLSPGVQELLVDLDYDSAHRSYEVNCSYFAAPGGLKGTSATTNNWLVAIVS
jgi:HK97 family phage major capsid protein